MDQKVFEKKKTDAFLKASESMSCQKDNEIFSDFAKNKQQFIKMYSQFLVAQYYQNEQIIGLLKDILQKNNKKL